MCGAQPYVMHDSCSDLAKELILQNNKIGDMGAEKLADALPHLANLTESWLEPCHCTRSHLHMCESPFWTLVLLLPSVILQCLIESAASGRGVRSHSSLNKNVRWTLIWTRQFEGE